MTVGELYRQAGPITATLLLVFAPIGMMSVLVWLVNWLDPEESYATQQPGKETQTP